MDGKQLAMAENISADLFHQILDLAIEGRGALSGAKEIAKSQLEKYSDAEQAVNAVIRQHLILAGSQGFATNWGGFFLSLLTIPANVAASSFVQARMVAAVAHLRGYELSDPRVRTALLMCILGPSPQSTFAERSGLPTSPLAVATAPVFDAKLDGAVAKILAERTVSSIGGKRLGVMLGKGIPFVGGGVGAAIDTWSTRSIARYLLDNLPSRRAKNS